MQIPVNAFHQRFVPCGLTLDLCKKIAIKMALKYVEESIRKLLVFDFQQSKAEVQR